MRRLCGPSPMMATRLIIGVFSLSCSGWRRRQRETASASATVVPRAATAVVPRAAATALPRAAAIVVAMADAMRIMTNWGTQAPSVLQRPRGELSVAKLKECE